MSLVIECDSCNSRYRLDLALVKGHGIRVVCRKCGAAIIVLSSEVAALHAMEPKAAQAPVPKPEPERSLPKEEPEEEGKKRTEEGSGEAPAAPKEIPKRPVFQLPAQPPWFLHPPVIALAVLVLLIAGIAGFITFTASGQKALATAVAAVQSLLRR
jgi:predicted Zn finger-like uncharacterized protein